MIYLDHAATSPLRRSALEAMWPFLTSEFANPSSTHGPGRTARAALEAARSDIALVLNCSAAEIVFTSGGTESDNIAVSGVGNGSTVVTSSIEHPALIETCTALRNRGRDIRFTPVDSDGLIDLDSLERALIGADLCSVMYANNEVGTIQPVAEIAELAHEAGCLMHTDAVQVPGLCNLDVNELDVDMLSISAHKFGGPKGVGALYVRAGTALEPLLHGGGQESHLRPGTENVAGAVGMAMALVEVDTQRNTNVAQMCKLRDELIAGMSTSVANARLTGHPTQRLANHASFVVDGLNGETLLIELENSEIYASSGSACAAGSPDVSHVLSAMGIHEDLARTATRMTLGPETTHEMVNEVVAKFAAAANTVAAI